MARKDRTGNRKTREQRKQFKVPELGYYLIVKDTEATERCFFTDEQMYGKLCKAGDEEKAIKIAQQKLEQCKRKCK